MLPGCIFPNAIYSQVRLAIERPHVLNNGYLYWCFKHLAICVGELGCGICHQLVHNHGTIPTDPSVVSSGERLYSCSEFSFRSLHPDTPFVGRHDPTLGIMPILGFLCASIESINRIYYSIDYDYPSDLIGPTVTCETPPGELIAPAVNPIKSSTAHVLGIIWNTADLNNAFVDCESLKLVHFSFNGNSTLSPTVSNISGMPLSSIKALERSQVEETVRNFGKSDISSYASMISSDLPDWSLTDILSTSRTPHDLLLGFINLDIANFAIVLNILTLVDKTRVMHKFLLFGRILRGNKQALIHIPIDENLRTSLLIQECPEMYIGPILSPAADQETLVVEKLGKISIFLVCTFEFDF
jgi:hypothetical protein